MCVTARASDAMLTPVLAEILACPRDKLPLNPDASWLFCPNGHRYPVVEGIPIFLLREMEQTHVEGTRALAVEESGGPAETGQGDLSRGEIDPFVSEVIGATNGLLYQHLVGKLSDYPIPRLRLPQGQGKLFLEIGCNWGRWCVAAAKMGYRAVGIDPSLKGIRAAKRVARQLGVEAHYLVADGRCLPFRDEVFGQVFSYSTLQHLSKQNARSTLVEICRVMRRGGECLIQMPNVFGVRCTYHQARRGFRETHGFEVRYWTPRELALTFGAALGPSRLSVDGYFSLNPQVSDLRFLPLKYRMIVRVSEALRKLSLVFPALGYLADSLYVTSVRKS